MHVSTNLTVQDLLALDRVDEMRVRCSLGVLMYCRKAELSIFRGLGWWSPLLQP